MVSGRITDDLALPVWAGPLPNQDGANYKGAKLIVPSHENSPLSPPAFVPIQHRCFFKKVVAAL